MDTNSVVLIAQGLSAQRLDQARLDYTMHNVKKQQELQASVISQLLASMPSANPEGVGGCIDCLA